MSWIIFFSSFFILGSIDLLIITICYHTSKRRDKIVLENSFLIKQLQQLNKNYGHCFNIKIKSQYNESCKFDKKYKYDNATAYSFAYSEIANNIEWYKKLTEIANDNKKVYDEYISHYYQLKSSATKQYAKSLKIPFKAFLKREQRYYEKHKLNPVTNVRLYCKLSYTSEAGRNYYCKDNYFNTEDIVKIINEIIIDNKRKQTIEHQRKMERLKLSSSMRYDVLTRDNFRCVLCGATAKEGAKLHVDHIIPVSKGGKTEMSNLRTLCDRCNLGKSDKIEKINKGA